MLPDGDAGGPDAGLRLETLRGAGYAPYYLYRQKYMSGSLENVGWAKPGTESLYNIVMMEELQTVVSIGGGGVTKLVDPAAGRIVRLPNPKYPHDYLAARTKFSAQKDEIVFLRGCLRQDRPGKEFVTMAYQLQEINRSIRADVAEFLAECDQSYAQRVSLAADRILGNLDKSPIVLLSGPSGSGKTTTAMKIAEELQPPGRQLPRGGHGQLLQDRGPQHRPPHPRGGAGLRVPPVPGHGAAGPALCRPGPGEAIIIPQFEFARQMRNDSPGHAPEAGEERDRHLRGHPRPERRHRRAAPGGRQAVYLRPLQRERGSALRFKGTWMRLTRRAVRDYSFRGTGVADTLKLWANVRRGEKLYISPYKNRADIMFDSSLPYEVSVMANYAAPLLQACRRKTARHDELLELIDAFHWFEPIDPDLVAPRLPATGVHRRGELSVSLNQNLPSPGGRLVFYFGEMPYDRPGYF